MTVRPGADRGEASGNLSLTRRSLMDSTMGSASQGARSARSAASALDDLTESSIAPDDEVDRRDNDQVDATESGTTPPSARDFVVYDTQSVVTTAPSDAGTAHLGSDSQTGTMRTAEIQSRFDHRDAIMPDFARNEASGPATASFQTAERRSRSSQAYSRGSESANSSATDWQRRRAERRQIIEQVDESLIDEEDHDDSRLAPHDQPTTSTIPDTDEADASAEMRAVEKAASLYDETRQTGTEAETEQSGTTFSSPAAARLARQAQASVRSGDRLRLSKRQESEQTKATPRRTSTTPPTTDEVPASEMAPPSMQTPRPANLAGRAGNSTTPTSGTPGTDREKMKAYLLNSVQATATLSARKGPNARLQALERLRAQTQLSRTPGAFSDGDRVADSDESASGVEIGINTPRARADRLGKANTIAAGRTPLPKGGIAELLRRGALSRLSDTSSSTHNTPMSIRNSLPTATGDNSTRSHVGAVELEALAGLSEASSNDLTAPPHASMHGPLGLRSNTSFPGLGAAEAGTDASLAARTRVDPARLAVYQSKLNARLDAENEELKRQLDQLREENERLRSDKDDDSVSGEKQQGEKPVSQDELLAEKERADSLDREAQELADLLDEREREIETLKQDIESLQRQNAEIQPAAVRDAATSMSRGADDDIVADLRFEIEELHTELKDKEEDLIDLEERLVSERKQMEEQLEQAKAYSLETLEKVEAKRDEAIDRVAELESELEQSRSECDRLRAEVDSQKARDMGRDTAESENVDLRQQVSGLKRRVEQLETESAKARETAEAVSLQLDDEKIKVGQLERHIDSLKNHIEDLEDELEDERHRAEERIAADPDTTPRGSEAGGRESTEKEARLQRELDVANDRIEQLADRLANAPRAASPDAHLQSKEIEMLKAQKAELQARVEEYRRMINAGVGMNLANLTIQNEGQDDQATPKATGAALGLPSPNTTGTKPTSPLPKSVLNLRNLTPIRTPRSPAPLSEASWLYNESSLGAGGVAERIAYLEAALDDANASIDAKLQKLDEAGVAHLTLAERLQRAHERIAELEAELERLRLRGSLAGGTSLSSPSKSGATTQRQRVFADVHAQLEALKSRWAGDHNKLAERERELERREQEQREYHSVLAELERFRDAAASLQEDVQREQAKQREMLARSKAAATERNEIEGALARTRAELETVKKRLDEKVGGLQDLSRSTSDSRRLRDARSEVAQLKTERLDLMAERAELHNKFARVNEKYEAVCADLELSRQTLAAHQAQLDEQIEQMESIHAALRTQKSAYDQVVGDRDRLRAERDEIVRDVGMFEAELRRVRREADKQGADLDVLRAEREEVRAREAREREHLRSLVHQLKAKTVEVEEIKARIESERYAAHLCCSTLYNLTDLSFLLLSFRPQAIQYPCR